VTEHDIGGSEALALGAIRAGVRFISGYPGSPVTSVVESLLSRAPDTVRIEWGINEKSAFDAAFGACLGGWRSLLCLKGVGLNVALDSLMVGNLACGEAGFVILVGDDPGAWSSQNEQDSRLLAVAAEVPLLEPTGADDCAGIMGAAFDLSSHLKVPVLVRITSALAASRTTSTPPARPAADWQPTSFERQPGRFTVLPANAVARHSALHEALAAASQAFAHSPFNHLEGTEQLGVVAAGFASTKLAEVLSQAGQPPLRVLHLSTIHPLPERLVETFLHHVRAALVLEELIPLVETNIQAVAQRAGLTLPILGRKDGHVPREGELAAPDIVRALTALLPDWPWPTMQMPQRAMPSRQALCADCPYVPAFQALLQAMQSCGGRDNFLVTGEPGCMVRAQLPPWELLDVKYGMGSSIGLAAGLARAQVGKKIVALSGDSALLHSGLGELIDVSQAGVPLLVVILANDTTALSGGQPHPATAHDIRGQPRKPVDLAALVRATGVERVTVVDPLHKEATEAALAAGIRGGGLSVVIVQRPCPRYAYPSNTAR